MIRYLLVLLTLISLASCRRVPHTPDYSDRVLMQFDTDEFSQVVWEYVAELKYDKRLLLDNAMVCFDGETKLRLQFHTQQILEMCEARELLVDLVEGLLDRVNHNQAVAEFLKPFPLTADQLEIYIDFESFFVLYDDPFYIGWVVLEQGTSYFYAANLKNKGLDFWNSRNEPYFKSRSYVQFEREGEKHYKDTHKKSKETLLIPERYQSPSERAANANAANTIGL